MHKINLRWYINIYMKLVFRLRTPAMLSMWEARRSRRATLPTYSTSRTSPTPPPRRIQRTSSWMCSQKSLWAPQKWQRFKSWRLSWFLNLAVSQDSTFESCSLFVLIFLAATYSAKFWFCLYPKNFLLHFFIFSEYCCTDSAFHGEYIGRRSVLDPQIFSL